MKNKTLAVWITFVLGPIGLHRCYLRGRWDTMATLCIVPSLAGFYGIYRARTLGLDDHWSWILIPWLGFCVAGCCLCAIVYGLMPMQRWNRTFNPAHPEDAPTGHSNGLTAVGLGLALMLGSTALMATLAFSIQRYFEYDLESGSNTSATALIKTISS